MRVLLQSSVDCPCSIRFRHPLYAALWRLAILKRLSVSSFLPVVYFAYHVLFHFVPKSGYDCYAVDGAWQWFGQYQKDYGYGRNEKRKQDPEKDGCYGIDFEDVTFNYTSGGKDALTSVNLHLEPGTVNAFVGPSGAGKTTAVQLLGRYWDTTGGTIKVGGVPITDLKTENLMDLTAFVFQDVFLLEDTLLENIRMGTNASEEEVRQAARSAQIDDFIMGLPKGYQTRIGDEGVKLSGGQQQRISIARAILKDAPIVIFDEATSYSDIENEHKIQLALQNLLKGKTTIMIAHRLHTIRDADKIVVFRTVLWPSREPIRSW